MPGRRRRSPPAAPDPSLAHFQASFFGRVADYIEEIGRLAGSGTIDPGQWVGGYARFLSGMVDDIGEWLQPPGRRRAHQAPPLCSTQVRHGEHTKSIPIHVPQSAFYDGEKLHTTITLVTGDLVKLGGEVKLVPEHQVRVEPASVRLSRRRTALKLFDLHNVPVAPGEVYRGLLWAKETKVPVSVVELEVVGLRPPLSQAP